MDTDVDMLRIIKVCTLDYITANPNQDIRATSVQYETISMLVRVEVEVKDNTINEIKRY